MSAFDKIMETNRKEQEEDPSEKKRERVSPHKGAARPELKKGRTSPQEEASTEEAHTDPDNSEHMEPMEEEEACFSDDPPEEEADKDDPNITGILKATSHIDITKNKSQAEASGTNGKIPSRKLSFAQTVEQDQDEEVIEGKQIFEIWLSPIDENAPGIVDKAAINKALLTDLALIFNTADRQSAAEKIMNMSVEPVPKTKRMYSVICATQEVAIDLKLALDEEGLKVPTVEGGSVMYRAVHSPRSTGTRRGYIRDKVVGAEVVVFLGEPEERIYISDKHIKNALKEAGLEVKKGPRRLPERNCDGIMMKSNRIQTRCVPIGYKDGTPLEEAMAAFSWPYKLRTKLTIKYRDESGKQSIKETNVWLRYAAKGEHANPPVEYPDMWECCHQPRGQPHHLYCPSNSLTRDERRAVKRTSREINVGQQSTSRDPPNTRTCHKYERGRCEEQDRCQMKHSETPIEKIQCNLPVANALQRHQLGMSPADHSVVCSRGGPPRCKYAHDQWTPDSHKKALEKEQKEMKNKSTTETNTRQNKTKKSNFKVEKKNRKKTQKSFDSTLGYPGEGPAEKLRMCTYNVNGLNEKEGQKCKAC